MQFETTFWAPSWLGTFITKFVTIPHYVHTYMYIMHIIYRECTATAVVPAMKPIKAVRSNGGLWIAQ